MKDLFDVQTKHMNMVFGKTGEIHEDDLVSKTVYELSTALYLVIDAFQAHRLNEKVVNKEKIKAHLYASVEWIMALFYVYELDPPEIEDIVRLADNLYPEVEADAILAALYAQRSLADLSLEHFCKEGNDQNISEMDGLLGEILACIDLIMRRLGSDLSGLIMNL